MEGNLSLPRVPKVCYVNFDSATLARDDVGERPWDRAFFRDTSLALLEKGNARVLAFDFGFTPKSMSSMVPRENTFRSDAAMGELVLKYPNNVVLGCLFSGVPTSYVKPLGVSAFAPYFKDGFSMIPKKLITQSLRPIPSSIIWMVSILVVSVPSRFLLTERLMRFPGGSHYGFPLRGRPMHTTFWEVREASWSLNCRPKMLKRYVRWKSNCSNLAHRRPALRTRFHWPLVIWRGEGETIYFS